MVNGSSIEVAGADWDWATWLPGTWHLPGGPVGPPARWAATSNVEEGSGTRRGPLDRDGGLCLEKLFAGAPSS